MKKGIILILLVIIVGVGGTVAFQAISEKQRKKEVRNARTIMYNEFVFKFNDLVELIDTGDLFDYSLDSAEENTRNFIEKIEETRDLIVKSDWCNTKDRSFNNECDEFKNITNDYLIKIQNAMQANIYYIQSNGSEKKRDILLEKMEIAVNARGKVDLELSKIESKLLYE